MSSETMRSFLSTVKETNRFVCPLCGPSRKNKTDRTLSVTVDNEGVLWNCHHCGDSGKHTHKTLENEGKPKVSPPVAISVPKVSNVSLLEQYLSSRGIDYSKISDRFKIVSGERYFRSKGADEAGSFDAIGFVYGENEAVKWRSIEGNDLLKTGQLDSCGALIS